MKEFICYQCKKTFFESPANRRGKFVYCTIKCKNEHYKVRYLGESNPCYRGGSSVFTCVNCGKKKIGYSKSCIECKKEKIKIKGKKTKKEIYKNWVSNNREKKYFINHKREMLKKHIKGSHTLEEWRELKKTFQYMCLCCKKQEPKIVLSEDHIVPISQGGTDYIWNIQPLCRSCNSRKRVKTIDFREVGGIYAIISKTNR